MTFSKDFLIILAGLWLTMVLGGCGEFFHKKTTELESKVVIRDISRVHENPHVGNPLPQVYRQGPKRLQVTDGVKLFYFTKYMPVGDLNYTDKDKNKEKGVHGYGGTIRDLGFKVSTHPSTNQLIIHCADNGECDRVLEYLKKTDVPPIQIHIDCLILERFGDVTKDWETTLLIENFLGQEITIGAGKYPQPAFPGAALRESRRSEFGLDFGYWMNQGVTGHQVRAVVDMLESRGYLKILMNPTLEAVNGKSAQVRIMDRAPIEKTVTESNDNVYTVTDYKEVSDTLTVTPYVYADGSVGLKTNIVIGSKSKPEGVVQTSIITERSIDIAENRIEPGKSLVIGGMRKAENRSVIRGIPFFKDLPLIGILFSSKDFEENATEIVFILTPSISSGGVEYHEMADFVREKFETPKHVSDWDELMTDPMGTKAYSNLVGKEADIAEAEKVRLQVQTAEMSRQARAERLRAEKAILEAQAMRTQAQQAQALIDKAEAEKKASDAQVAAAAKEAQAQQAKASQTRTQIEKAVKEAQEAKAQAQKAKKDLENARRKANELSEQVKKNREQTENIRRQIQELEKSRTSGEEEQGSDSPQN
ncbi:MAG: hypothetical protein ISS71_06675 [Phycisphaerae bacterium]|nr:hypothetical protein [Phycisphaerae bacterium]